MSDAAVDRVAPERLALPLIVDVCIDVNDVDGMTVFWETLLHYDRAFQREGHVYLIDPSGRGPHIYLQQVPERRGEKNRLHLDIVVPSLIDGVRKAVGLGAVELVEHRSPYTSFVVLADPEGNEFCLVDLATWQETRPPWWQHD